MELGKARVPNKGHDKTTSFSLDSKLKQRFFRINIDTYFCNASIKPVSDCRGIFVSMVQIDPILIIGNTNLIKSTLFCKCHKRGFNTCMTCLSSNFPFSHLKIATNNNHLF